MTACTRDYMEDHIVAAFGWSRVRLTQGRLLAAIPVAAPAQGLEQKNLPDMDLHAHSFAASQMLHYLPRSAACSTTTCAGLIGSPGANAAFDAWL